MSDAWNNNSSNGDVLMNNAHNGNGNGDEGWGNAPSARSPSPRGQARSPSGARVESRRSRSRSPARGEESGGGGGRGRGDGGVNPGNNLHISGLSSRVDNRELESYFSKVGKVAKAAVMYDPHTRESRGFGFVTMENVDGAEAAINQLNATELMGKTLTVERARRGRARTPTPGRYFGPPKRGDYERPYDPRPYDSRYAERGHHDRGGRFDDRRDDRPGPRGGDRRYDDRRYDDRRYDDRRYDDRRYDDRRYDDRRY